MRVFNLGRDRTRFLALMVALWVCASVQTRAAIVPAGDYTPAYNGVDDPWEITGKLKIGDTGIGSLSINNGGVVTLVNESILGWELGSSGTASISGSGSMWNHNGGSLTVGYIGTGNLSIADGAQVDDFIGYIGRGAGSVGAVSVDGTGSVWTNSNDLFIGEKGNGSLAITNGAQVSNSRGFLGGFAGTTGNAVVTGPGSLWDTRGFLTVGAAGTGSVEVMQGAVLNSDFARLGQSVGSNGSALVDGPGSQWNINQSASVGYFGESAVRVTGGGVVNLGNTFIAERAGSVGVVDVDGAGSVWNGGASMYVGYAADGTLNITNGGQVASTYSDIGYNPGSTGTVSVLDQGTSWSSNNLNVGNQGAGTLNIEQGGVVNVTYGTWVGRTANSTGTINFNNGTLNTQGLMAPSAELLGVGTINTTGLVSDTDITFNASTGLQPTIILNSEPGQNITINLDASSAGTGDRFLGVGYRGAATLLITEGLAVTSEISYLGYHSGSTGMAVVDGPGSVWVSGSLNIGEYGTGTLDVINGGQFDIGRLDIAANTNSTGTLTVSGPGVSRSIVLRVGRIGNGTLNLENGAVLETTSSSKIGFLGISTGTANITGPGSVWNSGGIIEVGFWSEGILNIDNGGQVNSAWSNIGVEVGSTGVVTVSGAGSSWSNALDMNVGIAGSGTLNILSGGVVSNLDGSIASDAGSTGSATVSGVGSVWNIGGGLGVGFLGSGTLDIADGGEVNVALETRTAWAPGSSGSISFNNGVLNTKGLIASRDELQGVGTINTTTLMSDVDVVIDATTGLQPQVVVNSQPGKNITINLDLSDPTANGRFGAGYRATGSLAIYDGQAISTTSGYLGDFSGSSGVATVDGNGSAWDIEGTLFVGNNGDGVLNIANGGRVSNGNGLVGYDSGTGTVTVSGAGSVWQNNSQLRIGFVGSGTLNIESGGVVEAHWFLSLGRNSTLNLSGGVLNMFGNEINFFSGPNVFNFTGGTLLNASKIDLGHPIVQQGGVLAPGGPIGQTDIIGEYSLDAGVIEIEVGGEGNTYDVLTATGDINLAQFGTSLELPAIGVIEPGTYTIIESTGGTINGTFQVINFPQVTDTGFGVIYGPGSITLTVGLFGDLDGDGFVGITDLNIILSSWNQSVIAGDLSAGDVDGNGNIGITDLNLLLSSWNMSTPPPSGTLALVPEPGTAGVFAVSVLWVLRYRKQEARKLKV